MKYPLIWLLKALPVRDQPAVRQVCRYHPTCSAYALEAVTTHGAVRGTWLAVRRVSALPPLGGRRLRPRATRHDSQELDVRPPPARST